MHSSILLHSTLISHNIMTMCGENVFIPKVSGTDKNHIAMIKHNKKTIEGFVEYSCSVVISNDQK